MSLTSLHQRNRRIIQLKLSTNYDDSTTHSQSSLAIGDKVH